MLGEGYFLDSTQAGFSFGPFLNILISPKHGMVASHIHFVCQILKDLLEIWYSFTNLNVVQKLRHLKVSKSRLFSFSINVY